MPYIDIDLDTLPDKEIIEELENRINASWKKKEHVVQLKQELQRLLKIPIGVKGFDPDDLSLADKMKFDYFIENFNKITEADIRKIV